MFRSPWLAILTPLARPDLELAARGGAGRGGAGTPGANGQGRSSARAAASMRAGAARWRRGETFLQPVRQRPYRSQSQTLLGALG